MKKLFDPLFITYCLLWIVIHLFRHLQQPIPVLNSYLTDFIAVPAMAHVTLTITRQYIIRNNVYTYPLSYLLFIAGYTAFIFEWLLPHYSPKYTSDVWDVVAYFGGSLFYYYVHGNRLAKSTGDIL
ncbi:MAG: hypothetical protein J7623_11445 [Chitinophaga sp.]|uniref:hypothetical protein n=1 Tax=Chitinophaga sp. TaxID=1869181 RepID=UPI001B296B55|nr:hypothetical protein [Chitinophaga sp.]MBO9729241.1 hypothetical protein [Chitinophaga sp.]